ncbi:MAG TPA: radical SAM protein [Candidatus Omnitrophota bacterium]|nr:radical SAM protein [Candidatus Omnitrophota bacterium]HPS36861.1 radical SAM protein [Candidatus Omnitrophota bacterium]
MTDTPQYKYIYGPVSSWRLGKSLGIDPISSIEKTCTFDCVYCQAGKTEVFRAEREVFVPTKAVLEELESLPPVSVDYITFAGNGEPTLAKNLGDMIRGVRTIRPEKIAVITNASLINRQDVQSDLLLADLIEAKLDACSERGLGKVSRPMSEILWDEIVTGLKGFRKIFAKHLTLQIMFVAGNQADAEGIARLACEIGPDEIEINTPLRVCAVEPLRPEEIAGITETFRRICGTKSRIRSVYEEKREKSRPFCQRSTEKRRGKENFG